MKKKFFIHSLVCLVLFAILAPHAILPANAELDYTEYSVKPSASEHANVYLLVNVTDNIVLAKKNTDAKVNPASTVKILAGLIACERLYDRLDEAVTITKEMVSSFEGYSFGLVAGNTLTFRSLLEIALCGSYNDAYFALAFALDGNISAFIQAMNDRARELGVTDSVFTDITGIHCGNDVTADDLMLCCAAAYRNELYMELSSARSYEIPSSGSHETRTIYNRNQLIYDKSNGAYRNPLCKGMNSGSTDAGGCCLATVAEQDGVELICIVLGGDEESGRIYSYIVANQLIHSAFSTFSRAELTQYWSGKSLNVKNSKQLDATVNALPAEQLYVYLPTVKMTDGSLSFSVLCDNEISAPIVQSQEIGYLSLKLDGEEIGRVGLVAGEDVEGNSFVRIMSAVSGYIKSRAFIITAVCTAILTAIYLAAFAPKSKNIRRSKSQSNQKIRKLK